MPTEKKRGRPLTGKQAVTKAMTVYLTPEQAEAVKNLAAERGVAPAAFVRSAVEKQLMDAETI